MTFAQFIKHAQEQKNKEGHVSLATLQHWLPIATLSVRDQGDEFAVWEHEGQYVMLQVSPTLLTGSEDFTGLGYVTNLVWFDDLADAKREVLRIVMIDSSLGSIEID